MTPSLQSAIIQRSPMLSGVLFSDDFDFDASGVTVLDEASDVSPAVETPPEPEPIDVDSIRMEAAAEARQAALGEVEVERAMAAARLCDRLSGTLAEAADEVRAMAEAAADSMAKLLVGIVAAALPAACARHGALEAAALAARVLPFLNQAPLVSVRVNPDGADAVAAAVGRLDPEMRARVQLVETEAMPHGDVRITWQDGNVVRDSATLWREIADVLGPLGLLVENTAEA